MRRRFNYTERKRILQENILVTLIRDNNAIKSFDAQFEIDDKKLPDNASIYIEAYHRTDLERYYFGQVGEKKIPNTDLSCFGYLENIKFRLKVVDETGKHGLILAEANGIRPSDDSDKKTQKRCILPVEFDKDLDQQVWRVDFRDRKSVV